MNNVVNIAAVVCGALGATYLAMEWSLIDAFAVFCVAQGVWSVNELTRRK